MHFADISSIFADVMAAERGELKGTITTCRVSDSSLALKIPLYPHCITKATKGQLDSRSISIHLLMRKY